MENTSAQLSSLPANTEAAAGALLSARLVSSIHMCAARGWTGLPIHTGNFRPFLWCWRGPGATAARCLFTYKDGFSLDTAKRTHA